MYKFENDRLVINKIDVPPLEVNLLGSLRASYNRYIDDVIFSDIAYLNSKIREVTGVDYDPFTKVRVEDNISIKWSSSKIAEPPKSKQVYATFTPQFGKEVEVRIVALPYLTQNGYFNVNGKKKILLSAIVVDEGISFNHGSKDPTIQVKLPKIDLTVVASSTAVNLKSRKPMCSLTDLILYYQRTKQIPAGQIVNPNGAIRLNSINDCVNETLYAKAFTNNFTTFMEGLSAKLGRAREMINDTLSIHYDDVVEQPLADDVYTNDGKVLLFQKGHMLTKGDVDILEKYAINTIYVQTAPDLSKLYTKYGRLISCIDTFIPENLKPFFTYVKKNTYSLPAKTPLTKELIKFLISCGLDSIQTSKGLIYFKREVMGNNTFLNGNLIPALQDPNLGPDDWVYFGAKGQDMSVFTPYDLTALFSLITTIQGDPNTNHLGNRDKTFLKRIYSCTETFSNCFTKAVDSYFSARTSYNRTRLKAVLGSQRDVCAKVEPGDILKGFDHKWHEMLNKSKLLASLDEVNPAAVCSHINKITTVVSNSHSISDNMRTLAMSFFGRICPFETPNGKKVGVVMSKALGADLEDGYLRIAVRKVIHQGDKHKLSKTIEYLNSREELNYVVGDILDLQLDSDLNITSTKPVLARVKTISSSGDVVSALRVDISKLDYVSAHPEAMLSPTAALVPFVGADDSIRCTFGLGMLKQAITIRESQKPIVTTFMYRKLFEQLPSYCCIADEDGEVVGYQKDNILTSSQDTICKTNFESFAVARDSVRYAKYLKKPGDKFKKGDVLIETPNARSGAFSPGRNAIVAYVPTGFNYDDAIEVSEDFCNHCVSVLPKVISIPAKRGTSKTLMPNRPRYPYLVPGDTLTTLKVLSKNEHHKVEDEHGILFHDEVVKDPASNDIIYKYYLLSYNKLKNGDKMAGRHGNKEVTSRVCPMSEMPMFANGKQPDILLNPCGVPSRMNVGQLLDAQLGFVGYLLGIEIQSDSFNGATTDDIYYLLSYVYHLANDDNIDAVINQFNNLPQGLHEKAREQIEAIREWKGCFNERGEAYLWDPKTQTYLSSPVTFGVTYFLKLEQESDEKIQSRAGSMSETYLRMTSQPTHSHHSGQRMGNMEMAALAEYGATALIDEIINCRSDNQVARWNQLVKDIGREDLCFNLPDGDVPRSLDNLRYYLETFNVSLDCDNHELNDISLEASQSRYTYNSRKLLDIARRQETDISSFDEI